MCGRLMFKLFEKIKNRKYKEVIPEHIFIDKYGQELIVPERKILKKKNHYGCPPYSLMPIGGVIISRWY